MSILDWEISTTPFAVVSVETTGFNPGHDRIVEVAVVHVSASRAPRVVFESLVNPMREVGQMRAVHSSVFVWTLSQYAATPSTRRSATRSAGSTNA